MVLPEAGDERRTEGARGVHRRARQRTADQDVEAQHQADAEAGDRPERPAAVDRDAEDGEDQKEGEDGLQQRAPAEADAESEPRSA